jgi:hypothetical protein
MEVTPEVIQKLRDLHPQTDEVCPKLPVDAPLLEVDPERIERVYRKRINMAADADLYGWSARLILPFFNDENATEHLAWLTETISNNMLPKRSRQLLLLSKLYACPKPKDPTCPRPVANPVLFTKAAGCYVMEEIADVIVQIFDGLQFGVGVPGGSEVALHIFQALVDTLGDAAGFVLVDDGNAFNAESRAKMLEAGYSFKELAPSWRFMDFSYGSPSLLVVVSKGRAKALISSEQGSRQGDTFGSLMFSLGTLGRLKQIAKNPALRAFAIIDDTTIGAKQWKDALAAFDRLAAAPNSNINVGKTKFFWPSLSPPPVELVEACSSRGLRLVTGTVETLGGIVGNGDSDFVKFANGVVNSYEDFFDTLQDPVLNKQMAHQLLRQTGPTKFVYTIRTVPPDFTAEASVTLDATARSTYTSTMHQSSVYQAPLNPTDEETMEQFVAECDLELPIRMGGKGLGATRHTRHQAYLSSHVNAARYIKADMLKFRYDGPKPRFMQHIERSIDYLAQNGVPRVSSILDENEKPYTVAVLPDEAGVKDLAAFYSKVDTRKQHRIQHLISVHLATARLQHIITYASDRAAARYLAQIDNGAGIFFNTSPGSHECYHTDLATTNEETILAHRFSRDLLPDPGVRKCPCGHNYSEPGSDPTHPQSCELNKKNKQGCYGRHERVVKAQVINEIEAGIDSVALKKVNSNGKFNSTKIPDGKLIYNDGRMDFTDVTVRHPLAPSKVAKSVSRPLADLDEAECTKHAKYDSQCERDGAGFTPLALNAYGGFGVEFVQHLEVVADHAAASVLCKQVWDDKTRGKFLYRMKQRLAVALQKGNADAYRYAIKLCRRVPGGYVWGLHYQSVKVKRSRGGGNHAAAIRRIHFAGLRLSPRAIRRVHTDSLSTVLYTDGEISVGSPARTQDRDCALALDAQLSSPSLSPDRTQDRDYALNLDAHMPSPSLSDHMTSSLTLSPIAGGRNAIIEDVELDLSANVSVGSTVPISPEDRSCSRTGSLCSALAEMNFSASPPGHATPSDIHSSPSSPSPRVHGKTFQVFESPEASVVRSLRESITRSDVSCPSSENESVGPSPPAQFNVASPVNLSNDSAAWSSPPGGDVASLGTPSVDMKHGDGNAFEVEYGGDEGSVRAPAARDDALDVADAGGAPCARPPDLPLFIADLPDTCRGSLSPLPGTWSAEVPSTSSGAARARYRRVACRSTGMSVTVSTREMARSDRGCVATRRSARVQARASSQCLGR